MVDATCCEMMCKSWFDAIGLDVVFDGVVDLAPQVSRDGSVKKERILILTDLLASAGSLVRPYVSSIMPQLLAELIVSRGV